MKSFSFTIVAWLFVTLTALCLAEFGGAAGYAALFVVPAGAVAFTLASLRHLPRTRVARLAWWTLTICGWAVVVFMAQGRWELAGQNQETRQLLAVAGLVALAVGAWIIGKYRMLPSLRSLAEAGASCGVIVAGIAGYAWYQHTETAKLIAQADARWAAIGRPMPEFEKTLAPREGNAALAVLGDVFLQEFNAGLYKQTAGDANAPLQSIPDEIVDYLERAVPPADIIPEGAPIPILDDRAAQRDAAYSRILSGESPMWGGDPADGFAMKAPNFLGVRYFAQLVASDATRRLERGDSEGAARALAAGLHVSAGLRECPTLVSLMIHVAVDAMLSSRKVRLLAEPAALDRLAEDVAQTRAALIRSLQFEAWITSWITEQMIREPHYIENYGTLRFGRLIGWPRKFLAENLFRRECAMASLEHAEAVAILQDPITWSLPDLGTDAWERMIGVRCSSFAANSGRASMRVQATLLLQEQTELLRLARARMAAGQPLESHDSVVLPNRRWEFTADPVAHTVSLRLDQIPQWLSENSIINDDFWLLPLDGSKSWQFRPPVKTGGL